MIRIISKLSFFFLIFATLSCEEIEDNIPDVPVNFTIDIQDPLYRELRTVGNSVEVIGGHSGIVIYRLTQEEFIAYDRICPVEIKSNCRIQATDNNLFYRCQCCDTPYLIIDGTGQSQNDSTFAGTGKFLKAYRTYYDGIRELRITN